MTLTTSDSTPFSTYTTVTQILLVLTSLAVGFKLGSSNTLRLSHSQPSPIIDLPPPPEPEIQHAALEDTSALEGTKEEDVADISPVEEADGDLAAVVPKVWEPCKLILVVRTDLKMSPGDIAGQCSDATIACYRALHHRNPHLVRHWEITGQAKIALKGTSEEQLLELEAIAKSLNLCARTVRNEELTKDKEGTVTVLGVGPAPSDLINKVTGSLRLL